MGLVLVMVFVVCVWVVLNVVRVRLPVCMVALRASCVWVSVVVSIGVVVLVCVVVWYYHVVLAGHVFVIVS